MTATASREYLHLKDNQSPSPHNIPCAGANQAQHHQQQQQQQSTLHSVLPSAIGSPPAAGSKHQTPNSSSSSSSTSTHMLDVTPPFMYSAFHEDEQQQAAAGLNLRASWLAGRAVHGAVLLAGCGIARGRVSTFISAFCFPELDVSCWV
jgi:hypothetical protein